LAVQEGAKVAEGSEADPRAILGQKLVACHRVQHPPGDGDLHPVGQADHHDVGMSSAEGTNYLNCEAEEWMVTVRNP
jgi:hypothetical protein